jgi:hypothetical protein
LMALRASGSKGIGLGWQGSDSALAPRMRTWASLVRCGRTNSCLRRAMVAGDGSTTVRGRLARRLQHFASTGERASGNGKGNGSLSAGGVKREADDADSRTAVGWREHGLISLAQRRAVPCAAVAIA